MISLSLGMMSAAVLRGATALGSLTVDFVNSIYERDGVLYGSLANLLAADGLAFTRASVAYSMDAVTSYAANAPRISLAGLLYEPAATNLCQRSAELGTAPWSAANGAVVTANNAADPTGAMTADTVTAGSGYGAAQQTITFASGAYTFSVWAKIAAGFPGMSFEIAGGASGPYVGLDGTLKRYAQTLTPGAGAKNMLLYVASSTGNNAVFWGVQAELGSKATSMVPTAGGTATRAADALPIKQRPGRSTLRLTFDDGSTQDIAQAAGVTATLPTAINRSTIRSIVAV